jgi:hypothetical protein
MATPIKRIPKEKIAVLHVCSQKEAINQLIKTTDKLSIIITGNGNPKDGYIYKVDEMGRDVKDINEKLTGICGIVKELHEKSIGENAVEKKQIIRWDNVFKIAGIIIASGMLYIGYKNLEKKSISTEQKIDNIGVPFVMNKRGEVMALPDSTLIKYFPNDSLKYVVKRIK